MANEIKFIRFKRTETAGRVPTAAQIEIGSVALNMADKAIFSKNAAGQVVQFTGAGADMPAKTVTATGTIKSNTGVQAGNAKLGTDGNITGGSKFGGNLDNYLNSIKGEISSTDKAAVKKAGDVMTGPLVINTSGNSDPAVNGLSVSGSQHTPIMLTRNTDKNLNIGFKLTGGSTVINRKLGIDSDGTLHWGPNDNQAANGRVVTQDYIDDNITELKGGYRGSEVGVDLGGWNGSVNDLFIGNSEDIGTVRTWFCASMAGGNNITDVPAGKGNFVLRVESLRAANGVDYKNKQTFISGDASKTYVRYGAGTGTTTAPKMNWGPWLVSQEFSNGVTPISNGGTGATTAGDARNNLGLRTAAVRDVGESSGNVMEVGAFGIGGVGKSIVDITSDVDLMTRLKAIGGTTFRANVKTVDGKPVWTGPGFFSHGSGFYSRAGDTMSALNIDYATGNVRVFAINDSNLNAGKVNHNMLYGTANKPSKDDVGLGNLTNDAQVRKAGDTMTGDLTAPNFHASGPGTASVYVNAGSGNAHVWFRTNANERGVIWATPNTSDLGQINIRAKTTGGTSAGDFSFRSDGRFDVPVAVKVGGAAMLTKDGNITSGSMFGGNLNTYLNAIKTSIVTGDNKQVSKTGDTMTGNLTINANLKVENPNGTFVDLGSENSDKYSRLTLARKVGDGAAVAMLKITPEGYVQFGYQDAVATPSPTKYIRVKPDGLDVEGDLVFNQTYRGAEEAIDISDKTIDLNDLVIKKTGLGTRQLYKCISSGGGSKITNKPTSDGNFVLEVLSLRKVSDTDWTCKQTFTTKNNTTVGTYVRYAQNGSWTAWQEVVSGVQPINLGGTGATSVAAARNNLGVGEGQTVSFGNLVTNDLTVNGNARLVGRLNLGSTSATGVLRANEGGAVVLGSASGQNIHVRAGTPDSSTGETRFEPNGNVVIGGALTASGNLQVNGEATLSRSLIVSQNIKNTNDNSFILMGKDSDLGFVKKSGSSSRLAFASGKSFVVSKSSATAISNPGSETYTDVFKVDADGNQTVYGNSTISRALTVSSVINANGGIIVPTTKYVQIADAPTQNNQAANKKYVDDRINTRLATAGGTVTGDLNVNGTVGLKGQVVLSKDLTVNNGKISAQAIELSMGTPYIDFHFNNSSSDYTTRLIENTSGELTLEGAFMCKKHMYAWGAVMARNIAPTNPPNGTLITGAPLQSMTEGRGGNGDARGLVANFYSEELVGTSHRAVIYLDGHKRTDAWIFNAGGVIDTPTGAVQTAGSDIRLKSNITPAKDGALERIMKLGTVEFDMKGETRRRRGFIAQQVEKVDAGYTFQGNEQTIDGEKIKILNIDQTAIVADLVSTVQEQQKLILELQKQINTLK
ncbi:tail fiber domain-containing protein [Klebsiella sp. 2019SCSN059]|uniref:tail fiber domain-containing protein n=1 Tax=Klebsiella sp. 2019SCSN059 TaxID=2911173 RepID=UPI001F237667|nr:tail fiber domain-containing protein [Klebsiella sp. 2019SCSN059]MCF8599486.1 tail fiber domain-containing protein [Klebsiella sp. 2019SCSN059]